MKKLIITLLLLAGCSSPLQCKSVKVAYWQDKADTEYPYKASYQCELPDGTTETVTPLSSKTRIPGCKTN